MFKFLEKDYYDHFHFINVVNLLQYMSNQKIVQTLMPYLQKTNINEYVTSHVNDVVDIGKRNIDIVKEILEVKCALQTTEMKDTSRIF